MFEIQIWKSKTDLNIEEREELLGYQISHLLAPSYSSQPPLRVENINFKKKKKPFVGRTFPAFRISPRLKFTSFSFEASASSMTYPAMERRFSPILNPMVLLIAFVDRLCGIAYAFPIRVRFFLHAIVSGCQQHYRQGPVGECWVRFDFHISVSIPCRGRGVHQDDSDPVADGDSFIASACHIRRNDLSLSNDQTESPLYIARESQILRRPRYGSFHFLSREFVGK